MSDLPWNRTFDGQMLATICNRTTGRPLAIIVAGHNGSGKSAMWYERLADELKVPMINADRMMASILPEPNAAGQLRPWAKRLRDRSTRWMSISQKGVESFTAHAAADSAPFAIETVFSYWRKRFDGTHASKADLIRMLQARGYFVVLTFVGLASPTLSCARVALRVSRGGHDVARAKLFSRFARTQQAIRHAIPLADAVVLVDNSRDTSRAFTTSYVTLGTKVLYDIRTEVAPPSEIRAWLDVVVPEAGSLPPSLAGMAPHVNGAFTH